MACIHGAIVAPTVAATIVPCIHYISGSSEMGDNEELYTHLTFNNYTRLQL